VEAGPYIQTVSGRRIDPFAPDPDQIDPDDIAQALSNQCRFGGHCRAFYSVAQHSCLVSDLVAAQRVDVSDRLWALLHDAPEAYLVDLPHPLKHRSALGSVYRDAEARLQAAICQRFGLPNDPPSSLKPIDRALLATERQALATVAWHWPELDGAEPLDLTIEPWSPSRAAEEFRARLAAIDGERRKLRR
jgi:5'-deoxynucleotidase YfbR-like HD superfamily hydrolase